MNFDVSMEGMEDVRSNLDTLERRFDGDVQKVVISDVDYAVFVEFGTSPHVITPKEPGGVLVFTVDGQTVFTDEVHHPGTPANAGLREAVREATASIEGITADSESHEDVVTDIAEFVRDRWKQKVPVDTGKLKVSIHIEEVGR